MPDFFVGRCCWFIARGTQTNFSSFAAGLIFNDRPKKSDGLAERNVANFKIGGLL